MKFKASIDATTFFFAGMALLFPVAISLQAFSSDNTIFGIVFAVLAVIALGAVLYDLFFASYVFSDEHVVFKAYIGREKITYKQIVEAHIRVDNNGKKYIYLSVGRRFPNKIRVKDAEGFLNELRRRKPDLIEETGD